jgi:hypothetical protein
MTERVFLQLLERCFNEKTGVLELDKLVCLIKEKIEG